MRGLSAATRYQEGLRSASLTRAPPSRPPRPDPHAHPVHDLAGPDPGEPAPLDLDLAHALHAGAQALQAALRARLDAEVVAALLGHRDRRDLLHAQRQRVVRHAGQGELAALAHGDVGHVALVHLHYDAI